MLTQAEQAIYDSLTAKYNTPAPAFAPVQQPVPAYVPPVPQTTPVNQMDAVNRYVDQIVEQKMAAFQAKMLETVVQSTPMASPSPSTVPPASPLETHASFIADIQKTVMNGLTLMQTGRFFQLAVGAGNKKEELFKNAILGFLKTEGGVKSLQAFADSLIKAIDGAGEEVEKVEKKESKK